MAKARKRKSRVKQVGGRRKEKVVDKNLVYRIITERILAKLDEGVIPWRKPWNISGTANKRWSGKEYRGVNTFLAVMSGREGPWLTFKMVRDAGGRVLKGEKSEKVVFWKVKTWTEKKDGEEKEQRRFILRYYNVFSLEQTSLYKEPDKWPKWLKEEKAKTGKGNGKKPIKKAEKIWKEYENRPELKHGGNRAFYRPSDDFIQLPVTKNFHSVEEYHSVKFHEMIHSTGHSGRLERFPRDAILPPFGSEDYSKEELVAEMGAAFLMAEAGIEFEAALDNSAAYIKSWMGKLEDDPKLVVRAASRAQRAVDHILGRKFNKSEPSNGDE